MRRFEMTDSHKAYLKAHWLNMTSDELRSLSAAWGCTESTVRKYALLLDLRRSPEQQKAIRSNGGFQAGRLRTEAVLTAPPLTIEDDSYVDECLRHGGFVRAERVGGRTVWISPSPIARAVA